MKKALIYPFSQKYMALVKFLNKLSDEYVLGSVCSSEGSGLIGHDIGYAVNRESVGIIVKGNPQEEIENNDTIFILPDIGSDEIEFITLLIAKAIKKGKNVICYADLPNINIERIKKTSNSVNFSISKIPNSGINEQCKYITQSIWTIDTPVIFVGGLIEDADQVEVIASLVVEFRKLGICACAICKDTYLELLNMYTYNNILRESYTSENTIMINNFIKAIENYEHPDVLIIQVPGTIVRNDNIITGDLGIGCYIFSQICSPDYFICCSMYDNFDKNFFTIASCDIEKRFGFKIDVVHMSNKMINFPLSYERFESIFYNIAIKKIHQTLDKINSNDIFISDLLLNEKISIVTNDIFQKLQE